MVDAYSVGDTVRILGSPLTGSVGTVVYLDHKRERYLVRIGGATQDYFAAGDLEIFQD